METDRTKKELEDVCDFRSNIRSALGKTWSFVSSVDQTSSVSKKWWIPHNEGSQCNFANENSQPPILVGWSELCFPLQDWGHVINALSSQALAERDWIWKPTHMKGFTNGRGTTMPLHENAAVEGTEDIHKPISVPASSQNMWLKWEEIRTRDLPNSTSRHLVMPLVESQMKEDNWI